MKIDQNSSKKPIAKSKSPKVVAKNNTNGLRFDRLPREILLKITENLSLQDQVGVRSVNRSLNLLVNDLKIHQFKKWLNNCRNKLAVALNSTLSIYFMLNICPINLHHIVHQRAIFTDIDTRRRVLKSFFLMADVGLSCFQKKITYLATLSEILKVSSLLLI